MIASDYIDGLYDVSHAYDGFILDQWGVLHNGVEPYPGVITCLNKLKANKKQVIILSNSGKRSDFNVDRLKQLGIKPIHYKSVVSAGEVVWQGLDMRSEGGMFEGIGDTCYLICRGNDQTLLDGLDINITDRVEDADFLLITGVDAPEKSIEDYEPTLRRAVAKGIPAICANPDMITLFGNQRAMGPGAVMQRYSEFGGVTHFIGKPHKPIFQRCLEMFKDVIPSRVLMVGDSLYHDVAGAQSLNIDTAFVLSGIHCSAKGENLPLEQKQRNVEQLIVNYGVRPNLVMDSLIWQSREAAKHEKEREAWVD